MDNQILSGQYLAAVDLGSNSFHMVVARIEDGHIHILDNLKEMVRLGAGLDKDGMLTREARERAIACLERFGERVYDLPHGSVAAVGTNTLRLAKNSRLFLKNAKKALGHPISVIAGKEEARLIYLGVSHSLVDEDGKRFVMDVGGGSTELIIGENFEPILLRSLEMGCVSMSRKFFPQGKLQRKYWRDAETAAHLLLRPMKRYYRKENYHSATGASGTIKAVGRVVSGLELNSYEITLDSMYQIRALMVEAEHLDALELPGLKSDRKPVFAGGLAVLIATFEALKIETMRVSDGALREGLLYERLGRIRSEDTRLKTVSSVQERFNISKRHARRVSKTAHQLLTACEKVWNLRLEDAAILHWASSLHEIGLAVALSGYQKHGAYLLDHADLPGFSYEEQEWMSVLVRCHRKKITTKFCTILRDGDQLTALRLVVLLRLATLLHRSRSDETTRIKLVTADKKGLTIQFEEGELEKHPLQLISLELESEYLRDVGFEFQFK